MCINIKSVLIVGIIATVLFGAISFGYAYTKASDLHEFFEGFALMTGESAADLPPTYQLAAAEWYFLVGMACFTTLGTTITQMITMAGQYAPMITGILPSPMMFYIIGILSGIIPGYFFLKEKTKFVDALVAALIPAVAVTGIIAVITSVAMSQMGSSPLPISLMSITDYLLVFVVTFGFIAIGTMLAAVIRHVMKK